MWPQYFWWSGMWIFPLLMLIVMIVALYLFVGRGVVGFCRPGHFRDNPPGESAIEIAKRRYAKGEINKSEFEQLKKDLAG